MVIFVLLGLLLAGAAVALLARAVSIPRVRVAEQLRQIETYGFDAGPEAAPRATLRVRIHQLAELIGRRLAGRTKALDAEEVRRQLLGAGLYTTTAEAFLGYRVIGAVGLPLFLLWYSATAGVGGGMAFAMVAIGAGAGWIAPWSFVTRRARYRTEQIDLMLPELIDLLVVTVEAGQGFSASMQTAAERLPDPLGSELRLALQEQRMGLSTEQALDNMVHRCDTPGMRSFTRSVLQGETLGVSIGTLMRNLAVDMRKRRRQQAEERIQKAPIKMLFPLIFLIFPAMFIVLLAPAVFQLMDAFSAT